MPTTWCGTTFPSARSLQQEQLARSLGDGHRVIHGVAGSGKTMILGYRAEQLAQAASAARPVLVLCYNAPLAAKLDALMTAKGLADRVLVRNFHKWCRQQLVAFGQPLPQEGPRLFDEMVDRVIRGVERSQIPSGQYLAVLIDEGHDFQPEWLKLVTQMVDPATNCLLLLYDDAQSIYERQRTRQFSFRSVGIQAQGRTTVLRINYRNTRQVLQTASAVAVTCYKPRSATTTASRCCTPSRAAATATRRSSSGCRPCATKRPRSPSCSPPRTNKAHRGARWRCCGGATG